ncbi:hypothetical protein BH18ACT12_BH18ACT12_18310 [soil metagenome]
MHHRSLSQAERGAELLLENCAALTRMDNHRPSAFLRLEEALGNELARLLVGALAPPRGERAAVTPL